MSDLQERIYMLDYCLSIGKITRDRYDRSMAEMFANGSVDMVLSMSGPLLDQPRRSVFRHDGYWRCHYCGSLVGVDSVKCPSCAGERR